MRTTTGKLTASAEKNGTAAAIQVIAGKLPSPPI